MPSFRRIAALLVAGSFVATGTAVAATSARDAQRATTITFWHAYSSDSPEVKTLSTVLIPRFASSGTQMMSERTTSGSVPPAVAVSSF